MRLVLLLASLAVTSATVDYTGHKVIRVIPTTDDHIQWLNTLGRKEHYDLWKDPTFHNVPVDVMVHPEKLDEMLSALEELALGSAITVDDVQGLIDASRPSQHGRPESNFTEYMDYTQIEQYITETVAYCGSRCQQINIGQSYENRNMWVIKISTGGSKRGISIDSGIHAREWIAHHTGLYILDRFVYDFGTDPDIDVILNNYDVYILPVVNPDGYVYTWTDDRLWRRTRNPHDGDNISPCVGADANRNYDFMWMTIGASDNPCDDTYAGPYPHSEPETANQRDFMFSMTGNWEVFFTLHTYGQLWMAPWGYSLQPPATYDELMRVGNIGADALTAVHGTEYTVGSASEILYQSSGTSRDWAYGHVQTSIPYVYTLELRNENSFVLPASEIIPTGQETWAGIKAAVLAINPAEPK